MFLRENSNLKELGNAKIILKGIGQDKQTFIYSNSAIVGMPPKKRPLVDLTRAHKKLNPVNLTKARIRTQARVSRLGCAMPFVELVERYLRMVPTVENMWALERTLKQKEEAGPEAKERAQATREEYVLRLAMGERDAHIMFVLDRAFQSEETRLDFVRRKVGEIVKQRKIPPKEAASVLIKQLEGLETKIDAAQKAFAELTTSIPALQQGEKPAEVRHELLMPVLQNFIPVPTLLKKHVERYMQTLT